MSTVMVVAPVVIANWGAISAAVAAVAGTMGFAIASNAQDLEMGKTATRKTTGRAEIEVDNSEILGGTTGVEQEMVIERDGVTIRFTRDVRGALKVCVEGDHLSKSQLHQIGEDLIGRVTQQYAYHRIVTEMKQRNMSIVHEEVDEDRTVRIRVKNF